MSLAAGFSAFYKMRNEIEEGDNERVKMPGPEHSLPLFKWVHMHERAIGHFRRLDVGHADL